MKKIFIFIVCIISIMSVLQGCANVSSKPNEQEKSENEVGRNVEVNTSLDGSEKICVGITLYSIQNEYTKRFADAAQSHAKQMGIELQLYDGNYDASRQNSQIEEMIQNELDGILLIPQDAEMCVEGVELAAEAGIPVISVNTRVNSNEIISYVGSDDIEAGELVAKCIAKVLNGTGNIVILEGPIGQSAQMERLEGIKNVLAEYPNLHVIGNKTANWSRLEAKNIMQKWLQTFERIDAVIAENDDMALGALESIEAAEQKIYVVGIDGSEDGLQAVEEGRMHMTVFQDAEEQSKQALELLVKHIGGETVDENYWIPLKEITTE